MVLPFNLSSLNHQYVQPKLTTLQQTQTGRGRPNFRTPFAFSIRSEAQTIFMKLSRRPEPPTMPARGASTAAARARARGDAQRGPPSPEDGECHTRTPTFTPRTRASSREPPRPHSRPQRRNTPPVGTCRRALWRSAEHGGSAERLLALPHRVRLRYGSFTQWRRRVAALRRTARLGRPSEPRPSKTKSGGHRSSVVAASSRICLLLCRAFRACCRCWRLLPCRAML